MNLSADNGKELPLSGMRDTNFFGSRTAIPWVTMQNWVRRR